MSLVQKQAPDFKAQAVIGTDITDFELSSTWKNDNKYTVLFFYPLDFTFVCPTEIIAFSDRIAEFEERKTQVVGVSVDSAFSHLAWKGVDRNKGGIGDIKYPLVADLNKNISADYGVLLDAGIALRGLFLIDQNGVVRHQLINDLPLGRSVDEILRIIDALQFTEEHGEVCPANWKKGDKTIKPNPTDSQEYFGAVNG